MTAWLARRGRLGRKRSFRHGLEAMEPITLLTTNGAIVESLSHAGAFTVNGSAVITPSGARMTDALDQSSSIWFNNLQTLANYTASFEFNLSNPGGIGWADGFTFAFADASKTGSKAIGAMGGGIGYAGLSGYAIEFDTYYNPTNHDPNYVHVGLDLGGSVVSAAVSQRLPFDIRNAGWLTASITYESGAISVSIAKPGGPLDQVLSATVPKGSVPATGRVGLTAATAAGPETAYLGKFEFTPQAVAAKSLTWDDPDGGVNFTYSSPNPVPFAVPVDFYWAPDQTFDPSKDALAASSKINARQAPSTIHIVASSLTTPPEGTGYLLAVLDPNHTVMPQAPGNTKALAYDPEISVTGTYNGSTDPKVIGRFLAVPNLVTESLIIKLSPSLGALRPSVITFISNGDSLDGEPDATLLGGWDGVTYKTDGFDPGALSQSADLSTSAQTDDKTAVYKTVDTTLDVQPLPDWYQSLLDPKVVFNPATAATNGALQGSYQVKGGVVNLVPPASATIPQDVAFVGGKSVGASATFGVDVTVPLDVASKPVVNGTVDLGLTVLGVKLPSKSIDLADSTTVGGGATLKLTPQVTLDPNTLQADGSFGLGFTFSYDGKLAHDSLYSQARPITISGVPFNLEYGLYEDMSYNVTADADLVLSPGSGFVLAANPDLSYVSVGVTGGLSGEVSVGWFVQTPQQSEATDNLLYKYLPSIFTPNTYLPALKLSLAVSGGATLSTRFNYNGGSTGTTPLPVSFGGSLSPSVDAKVSFTIGTKTYSLPSIKIFNNIPSLVFNGNGQYSFNKMGG
jgi:hypothetical protein